MSERLRAHDDQRAVFVDVYVVIARKVVTVKQLDGHDGFLDPDWLCRLTGRFAKEALVAALRSLEQRSPRDRRQDGPARRSHRSGDPRRRHSGHSSRS